MRTTVRIIVALTGITVGTGQNVKSQEVTQVGAATATPACDGDSRSPGAYLRCALWIDRDRLRRGVSGEELARGKFLAPLDLYGNVRGDSARYYAARYKQSIWAATVVEALGAASITGAIIAGRQHGCTFFCSPNTQGHTARVLGITGASFTVLSLPFLSQARRHEARAIWWHNALLGR